LKKKDIKLNKKEVKEVKYNKTKHIKRDNLSKNVNKISKVDSNSKEDIIEEKTTNKNTDIKYPFYNTQHMNESIENNTNNIIKM
jgi:hypothetical protein